MLKQQSEGKGGWKRKNVRAQKFKIFAPEQKGFTGPMGIPIIEYEISGGVRQFRRFMRRRWRRARKIASTLIGRCQIPVTPLCNPVTQRSSCHIIKLVDKKKADYSVDQLVFDCNLYLAAFRRQLKGPDGIWTGDKWYKYSDIKDEKLPPEISRHAESLGFDSSHKDSSYATPGGTSVMHHLFQILSRYEDCGRTRSGKLLDERDRDKVEAALLKLIVIFCETLRFRSLYMMMVQRIRDDQKSSTLDSASWKLIHNWGEGSMEVQQFWNDDLPPMHTPLPNWFDNMKVTRPGAPPLKLRTLGDLIGEVGEIMVINAEPHIVSSKEEIASLENELRKNTSKPIPEPGFD